MNNSWMIDAGLGFGGLIGLGLALLIFPFYLPFFSALLSSIGCGILSMLAGGVIGTVLANK